MGDVLRLQSFCLLAIRYYLQKANRGRDVVPFSKEVLQTLSRANLADPEDFEQYIMSLKVISRSPEGREELFRDNSINTAIIFLKMNLSKIVEMEYRLWGYQDYASKSLDLINAVCCDQEGIDRVKWIVKQEIINQEILTIASRLDINIVFLVHLIFLLAKFLDDDEFKNLVASFDEENQRGLVDNLINVARTSGLNGTNMITTRPDEKALMDAVFRLLILATEIDGIKAMINQDDHFVNNALKQIVEKKKLAAGHATVLLKIMEKQVPSPSFFSKMRKFKYNPVRLIQGLIFRANLRRELRRETRHLRENDS